MATHLSTENLVTVLEAYALGRRWRASMATIGASEDLAYKWLAASRHAAKDDDVGSIYYLEHRGVFDWWHAHCRRSRSEALNGYESIVREQAAYGIEIPVLDSQGRQLWKERADMAGHDDDMCDLIFGHHDRIERDERDHAVPLTRIEQIPATTRNKILDQIAGYREPPPSVHIHNNLRVSAPLKALRRAPAPSPTAPLALPPPETDLVRDLRAKLKAGVTNPKPDGPVAILGRSTGEMVGGRMFTDKPEQVNEFPPDVPATPDIRDHPRAYTAPAPAPKPAPSFARRLSSGGIDQAGMGRGPDPSMIGKSRGFRVS